MRQYSAENLNKIFMAIAPSAGLILPVTPGQPAPAIGPAVCVSLRYSEIVPGGADIENRYWDVLRQVPVIGGVGVLASLNSVLSEHRAGHRDVHKVLNERFLPTGLARAVAARELAGPGFAGVFTRIGCLQLMRHLLLYGRRSVKPAGQSEKLIGELALLTNDYLQLEAIQSPSQPETLELLLSFLPMWDVYNPRELAYALGRMFIILTDILPGNDPEVRKLASRIGLNASKIMIGALPLNDFIAAVFGLFAYGRQLKGPEHAIFDVRRIFANVGFPTGILRRLVNDRALSATAFRKKLSGGAPHGRQDFGKELQSRSFLTESLNIFRQSPLLKLDPNRMLILDLDFLVELLTSGVYWSIFDSLPRNLRPTFKELWGRLFELYAVALLEAFYPPFSRILTADLDYDTGQVDALLDFGQVAVVFEVKSSLLTEGAKRSGRTADFVADFGLKFVRDDKGKPKALVQLAASCKAIAEGRIPTVMKPGRIYPVCVSDEPAVESFFFTTYSNELFQKEVAAGFGIQPVTMMSVNELEEILPYVSAGSFSWEELLDFRLNHLSGAFSVHQAIYDLLRQKGLPTIRNQKVREGFDDAWRAINSRYKPPVAA
jgi:hypothetical protein